MKAVDVLSGELVEVKFFTQWQTPLEKVQEPGSPETMTEMAYVPPKAQIEEMMRAGAALEAFRRARFGEMTEEQLDEEILIPPGADLVDVQRLAEQLAGRISKREREAAAAAGAAARAADEKRVQEAAEKLLAARQQQQGAPGGGAEPGHVNT